MSDRANSSQTPENAGHLEIVEGPPGELLIQSYDDVIQLITTCFERHSQLLLLYAENLSDRFFDLSSGLAGEVLQKLRNYRIRVAIVIPPDGGQQSPRFREMMLEENRRDDVRTFNDRESAEEWLQRFRT